MCFSHIKHLLFNILCSIYPNSASPRLAMLFAVCSYTIFIFSCVRVDKLVEEEAFVIHTCICMYFVKQIATTTVTCIWDMLLSLSMFVCKGTIIWNRCSHPHNVYLLKKSNSLFNSCSFDHHKIQIQTETHFLLTSKLPTFLLKQWTFETFDLRVQD